MKIPHDINKAAIPSRNPTAWAAMFARVKAAGADGVAGHKNGTLYLTKDGRPAGTIPMINSDRACWA